MDFHARFRQFFQRVNSGFPHHEAAGNIHQIHAISGDFCFAIRFQRPDGIGQVITIRQEEVVTVLVDMVHQLPDGGFRQFIVGDELCRRGRVDHRLLIFHGVIDKHIAFVLQAFHHDAEPRHITVEGGHFLCVGITVIFRSAEDIVPPGGECGRKVGMGHPDAAQIQQPHDRSHVVHRIFPELLHIVKGADLHHHAGLLFPCRDLGRLDRQGAELIWNTRQHIQPRIRGF